MPVMAVDRAAENGLIFADSGKYMHKLHGLQVTAGLF